VALNLMERLKNVGRRGFIKRKSRGRVTRKEAWTYVGLCAGRKEAAHTIAEGSTGSWKERGWEGQFQILTHTEKDGYE